MCGAEHRRPNLGPRSAAGMLSCAKAVRNTVRRYNTRTSCTACRRKKYKNIEFSFFIRVFRNVLIMCTYLRKIKKNQHIIRDLNGGACISEYGCGIGKIS